jgi:hypothetical protein
MSCNHDCNQGRNCNCAPNCAKRRQLSYRGKVWLAYFVTLAASIGTAVAVSYLISNGVNQ